MPAKKAVKKVAKKAAKKPIRKAIKRETHSKETLRGNRAPNSAAMIDANIKQEQALEMRRAGHSFEEIARELGYANRSGAHKAVMAALSGVRENTRQAAELEYQRLEKLHKVVWKQAMTGDLAAVDRAIKLSERRAKMFGLDQQPSENQGDAEKRREFWKRQIARVIAEQKTDENGAKAWLFANVTRAREEEQWIN